MKKLKPAPVPCTRGALPVVVRVKGRGYGVYCAAIRGCDNNRSSLFFPKEEEAVNSWNDFIIEKLERMAKK